MKHVLHIFFLQIWCIVLNSQNLPFVSQPDQLNNPAFADWISTNDQNGVGVYYFRNSFTLKVVPTQFIVHVSADNRYRLFINEKLVSWGPAAGDLNNWFYESVDIATYLTPGKNCIAAQVWNAGEFSGARQISNCLAFIVQGNSKIEQVVNTNKSWKVSRDSGYYRLHMSSSVVGGGYIAGGTDSIVAAKSPNAWNKLNYNDENWLFASELGKGNHTGLDTWLGTPWKLRKREIPAMEQNRENLASLLSVKGMDYELKNFNQFLKIKIPAHSKVELLFDHKTETMGFPRLDVNGGKGSKIKVQYQESLFDSSGLKGNRNAWQGKEMKGYYDVSIADGNLRTFEPLWLRVFRYIKITIETQNEELIISDFYNLFTAYPFEQKGSFNSNDTVLKNIWDASWRTARLCALETYMDCPYYEQLQYVGDTRIQALISMYVTGDDRLVRNAIDQLYNSMQPMGLTKSSYPTAGVQIIPPFSLLFIDMVHDYFMLRNDSNFVKQYIPGIKFILAWFINKIDTTGMLGPLPYWNHIDGGTSFVNGSPPGVSKGGSAHISILLAYTLDKVSEMLFYYNQTCEAEKFRNISSSLKLNTLRLCYDSTKTLIAETPAKNIFSQHTNSMAILANMFSTETKKLVADKVLNDRSLIQATLYFNFYVFQALNEAGYGNKVLERLHKWNDFLDAGFTTFPEHGINSRSDCHAWSAHPLYDLLSITCGITPSSPGFKSVTIKPNLGNLKFAEGEITHPAGLIHARYEITKANGLNCFISLPDGVTGNLIYHNKTISLKSGMNELLDLK